MHGEAMPYAIVSNNISGTHWNLKNSKLVYLSGIPKVWYEGYGLIFARIRGKGIIHFVQIGSYVFESND